MHIVKKQYCVYVQ